MEATPGLARECGFNPEEGGVASSQRFVSLEDFVVKDEDRPADFAFGLTIFDLYRELYETEYRFVARHERPVSLFGGRATNELYLEAVLGAFPIDSDLAYIREGYVEAFDPEISKLEAEEVLEVFRTRARTPLSLTRHGIETRTDGSWDTLIFFVDPTSTLDILDLWNLRLFAGNVLPVNVNWLNQWADYLVDRVNRTFRPIPQNPFGTMFESTIEFGRSLHPDRIESIREVFAGLPAGSWHAKQWYDPIWSQHAHSSMRPRYHSAVTAASDHIELTLRENDERRIEFRSLSPKFANRFGRGSARWVNVLNLSHYSSEGDLALTLPSNTEMESRWPPAIGETFLVSREGLILHQEHEDHLEYIRLLSGREAIIGWFEKFGITAQASDAGRIAEQVISAVGGFWGARILADKATLILLNKMAKSVTVYGESKTVEEYSDRAVHAQEWIRLAKRRHSELPGVNVDIDSFVQAGAIKLGISVGCPNCGKKNWHGIGGLKERVSCERCLKEFDFPQGSLDLTNTPWMYRVVGPFAVPDFAQGSYSTVLALRCLAITLGLGHGSLTYSTSLDPTIGDDKFEIDFACWYRTERTFGFHEEPVFIVGEAKSFGNDVITEKDTHRLKQVATRIPSTVLIIAVLKDSLSDGEKGRIAKLAKWGRQRLPNGGQRAPVIVLTGMELFAEHDVENAWKEAGGNHRKLVEPAYQRLDDLQTLASLTQRLYLDLPPA